MNQKRENACMTSDAIRSFFAGRMCDFPVYVHEIIDSTNTEAKRLAANGERDCLIAAVHQTAGRGRLGRSFSSPADTGAYFTLLYTPDAPIDTAVTATCAASVAAMRAIRTLTGKETGIKWVNDLYLDGKKVAGILCESVCVDGVLRIIVGIGINISTAFDGTDLEGIAGSLSCPSLSPAALIAEVVCHLYPFLSHPQDRSWLEDYRRASTVLSRRVRFTRDGETQEGIALRIEEDGALCVRTDDGTEHRLFSGEITVRTEN